MGIKHSHITVLPNDPDKDVSADAWNDDHTIEPGTLEAAIGVDSLVPAYYMNPVGVLYLKKYDKDVDADGDQKFAIDDDGIAGIYVYDEIYNLGGWRFNYATAYLAWNLALSAAGDQLITENVDGSAKHLYVRSEFSEDEGTNYPSRLHLNYKVDHFISQSDDSEEVIGTFFTYIEDGFIGGLLSVSIYLKIGSVNATDAVTIDIYNGPDNTYTKKFSQRYAPSKFSVRNGTVSVVNDGGVAKFLVASTDLWGGMEVDISGFTTNTDYNGTYQITSTDGSTYFEVSSIAYGSDESGFYETSETKITVSDHVDIHVATSNTFEISSPAPFSIKVNAAKTHPWVAGNFYPANYYNLLDTEEWVEGEATDQEDWYIEPDIRKIYASNDSQTKGATFSADAKYWNGLSPFIFSWEKLPSTQNLLIPENHQMVVHGTFTMEGDLNLQGTLVIRS